MTQRQLQTLTTIRDLTEVTGLPPTIAELGRTLGIAAVTAREIALKLERDGLLERLRYRPRSIRLTAAGRRALKTASPEYQRGRQEGWRAALYAAELAAADSPEIVERIRKLGDQ